MKLPQITLYSLLAVTASSCFAQSSILYVSRGGEAAIEDADTLSHVRTLYGAENVDYFDGFGDFALDSNFESYDAVFVSANIFSNQVGGALVGYEGGVFIQEAYIGDDMGLATSAINNASGTTLSLGSGPVTALSGLSGDIEFFTSAPGGEVLGYDSAGPFAPGAADSADFGTSLGLISIDAGGELLGGGSAAGRRVSLVSVTTGSIADYTDDGLTLFNAGMEYIAGAPVPEPSAYALLIGTASLGLAFSRRRRNTGTAGSAK